MNAQQYTHVLIPIMLIASFLHARDPQPMNAKFNIGQDLITSYEYGLFNFDNQYLVKKNNPTEIGMNFSLSYGITRSIGFTFTLPFLLKKKVGDSCSRGLSDLSCIIQWHLLRSDDQLIVFKTGMQFPTGDTNALPSLGSGSFNPTLSLEGFHSSERLFASILVGANIATPRSHKTTETLIDYEITIGPKFPLASGNDAHIYTFLELQGFYGFPGRLHGEPLLNTGGHLVFLGPILSYDNDRYQYLFKIQFPIADRRFGMQTKIDYFASLSFQCDI